MIPTLKENIKQNILDTDLKPKRDTEKVQEVSSANIGKNVKNDSLLSGTKISNSLTKHQDQQELFEDEQDIQDEFNETIRQTFQDFIKKIVDAIIEFLQKINPFIKNKTVQKARTKKELKELEKKLSKK